ETSETLLTDLIALIDYLDLPEKQDRSHHQIFSAFKRWLNVQSNCLLILDNVEEFDIVRELLPNHCTGHVLLTTRRQGTSASERYLKLPTWSTEEGTLFLLQRAKFLPQQASLEAATDELRMQATDICQELG